MSSRTGSARLAGLVGAGAILGSLLATGPALAPLPAPPAAAGTQPAQCEDGAGLVAEPTWNVEALDLAGAHRLATGAGVRVAVVDSGVAADGPHLEGAVLPGVDVVGVDAEVTDGRADAYDHGTAVATLLAGRATEGSGLIGVAPDALVIPIRVYYAVGDDAERRGVELTEARLAAGIRAAIDADADVVVVAVSSYRDDPAVRAAVEAAEAAGALVVASMGNVTRDAAEVDQPRYPAAYPGVLAVAGIGEGWQDGGGHVGEHADLAGPGIAVLAGLPNGSDCVVGEAGSSTSWATAQVAGAAALLVERFPDEGPEMLAYRLTATAARPDPDGWSEAPGWGLVQPRAALELVDDGSWRGVDSPRVVRPSIDPVAVEPVKVIPVTDPWVDTRRTVAWWAVAGAAALLAVVITGSRRSGRVVDRPGRRS
ncbi:MAG: hypothetical protein BGO96_10140 [Micrococcales bacterium 73-15]|uniref:S8 family serine peptidase n=1 Tax=Salana multivorans TaxID=120377 RepID=UPI00095DFC7B|nr:S8 family serine peptidase [Salana multivorans]OJX93839.1 MAG: hypothetical protein BGO96_10140 [Micrococcales bacterium 73-15]